MGTNGTGGEARRAAVRLLCVLGAAFPASAGALTVHVASGGSDGAPGTEERPVASIGAALERLRGVAGERELRLARGVYPVRETIVIGAEDSGSAGQPLRITAAGEGVVLSGFLPLLKERWSKVVEPGVLGRLRDSGVRVRLVCCVLPERIRAGLGELSRRGFDADDRSLAPPAMLYMAGRRMQLARWPDMGTVRATRVVDAGPVRYGVDDAGWDAFWSRGGAFEIADDRARGWADPGSAWVNGRFGNAWEWSFNRVAEVLGDGRQIRLAFGEVSGVGADELHPPEFFFENVLEELDRPGEYYIDRVRGIIYFLPPAGAPYWANVMRLSWLDGPVLKIDGARHVQIRGLAIEGGRGGGIVIEAGEAIDIDGVRLADLAGDGVVVDGREVRLSRLAVEEVGGRGLVLRGGDPRTLRPSGNVVSDSRFVATGWWGRVFRPAIALEGVGHQVERCQFSELPHMAIEVDGNDFEISGCWFSRTCIDFRDMCAIYFNLGEQPQKRGTVIRGNLFQDIGVGSDGGRGGVYLDNGTMGVTITDNVFHRVGEGADGWAVMNHGGAYIRVEDNVFIDCAVPYHVAYWWNTWGKGGYPAALARWREILGADSAAPYLAAYPELENFFEEERVLPDSNTFSRNRIANPRRAIRARRGWSSFGGPAPTLKAEGNVMGEGLKGLRFDSYGRPVVPGWRPWGAVVSRADG